MHACLPRPPKSVDGKSFMWRCSRWLNETLRSWHDGNGDPQDHHSFGGKRPNPMEPPYFWASCPSGLLADNELFAQLQQHSSIHSVLSSLELTTLPFASSNIPRGHLCTSSTSNRILGPAKSNTRPSLSIHPKATKPSFSLGQGVILQPPHDVSHDCAA
jgi:hypothetical protein